jgi:hypothetical protein
MRICTEHETKYEHDRSHSLLKEFLKSKKVKRHLSTECISAILKYGDALICKETYLSNHHRMYITNCMDSATTSPVESQNQIVHGHLGVRTNLNIEKGIERMAKYTDERAVESHNQSLRNLEQINLSSRSPTSKYIIVRSQAIADQNYDYSKKFKLCQVGKYNWLCWCFESRPSDKDSKWPLSALPHYRRVREIIHQTRGELHFLWCDCGFYDRIGIPCVHIFRVIGEMTLNMLHIRHWRYYEAFYNDPTNLGQLLVRAQQEHFDNEGMGVRLTPEQVEKLMKTDEYVRHVEDDAMLSYNTTLYDWADARFVKDKCREGCCLSSELEGFIVGGRIHGSITKGERGSFTGYRDSEGFTSREAQRMQTNISLSSQKCDSLEDKYSGEEPDDESSESMDETYDIGCTMSRDEIRKSIVTMTDAFLNNERVSKKMVKEYYEEIKLMHRRMLSSLETESLPGQVNREFEFACNEGAYRSPQKRKPNALDY